MNYLDRFESKTRDLQEALDDARCQLEELEECGDLEDRLAAAFEVEEAERRLQRHLLKDQQEGEDGL